MIQQADETLEGFRGEYYFLSNMYEVEVVYKGITFASSEHLYQWLKVPPEETWWRDRIREAPHGKVAKKLVNNPKCPKVKTDDWDAFRIQCMKIAVWAKFRNPDMARMLLDTGDMALVEHNFHKDQFFGVYQGSGQNQLGRILMLCRNYLRTLENTLSV